MTKEEAIMILKDCELNPCVPKDKEAAEMAIEALEQEPKQGHWIVVDDCGDNLICECSECKDEVWFKDASRMWNYCSSCGARMKGVEE